MIRHSIFTLLCVLALLLFPAVNSHSKEATILVLGDSLSAAYGIKQQQGWVALLDKKLKKNGYSYRIVNASISGETTGGGLARLQPLIEQHQPALLLVELGANDGLRGFPINLIQDNLQQIIKLGQNANAKVLLIAVQIPFNYGPRYTTQFEKNFIDLAATHKIKLAPSLLGKVPLNRNLMLPDGLHPNASAQPELLNNVWPYLQPLL